MFEARIVYVGMEGNVPFIVMTGRMGQFTGYVWVPANIGLDFDDLSVHGGITWGMGVFPMPELVGGDRWIGWDAAHAGDYLTALSEISNVNGDHKWTPEEAIAETRQLAAQVKGGRAYRV